MDAHPKLESCWLEGNPFTGAATAQMLGDASHDASHLGGMLTAMWHMSAYEWTHVKWGYLTREWHAYSMRKKTTSVHVRFLTVSPSEVVS
eukprot:scaffold38635_cov23-Tisochrysis_lutea.AAC.1